MRALTYEGWRLLGYQVVKGEKSTLRSPKGEPLFTREQVKESGDIGDFRMTDDEDTKWAGV